MPKVRPVGKRGRRPAEAALWDSEERARATLRSIGDAVIATDWDGLVKQMNPVAEKLTGWTEGEALSKPIAEVFRIVNEETRAEVGSPVDRVLRQGQVVGLANHTLLIAKEGAEHPIADSGAPIRDEKGDVTGVVLVFRDQTEERAAQRALQDREEAFRALAENASDGILVAGAEGVHVFANRWAAEITGYSIDELTKLSIKELAHPDEFEKRVRERYERVLAGKPVPRLYETVIVRKDHQNVPVEVTSAKTNWHGQPADLVILRDISERKRVHEALRESEEKYRGLFDNAEVGMYRSRLDGSGIVALNQRLADIFGFSKEEMMASPATIRWADPNAREEMVRVLRERGELRDHELGILTKGGEVRTVLASMKLYPGEGYLEGTAIDVTERKQAEEALRESQRALVEAQTVARVGSWQWDAVGDKITGSEEFYRLFDVAPEELTRFSQFAERLHPDDRARVEQDVAKALHLERPYDTDYRVKLRDGGWRDINARGQVFPDDGGKPLRMVGTCLDITESKQAEAELRIKNQVFEDSIASQSVADENGVITLVNPAFLRLWGYATKEEAAGKSVGTFFANPADATPVLEALAAHDAWEGEFLAKRTDGSTFVSRGYATSLRSAAGALIGYQSTNLDVTRERENEAALRQSEQRLRRFYESGLLGVFFWNTHGQVLAANDKFLEMVGYTQADLAAGRIDWVNMTPPEYRHRDDASVVELKATGVNKTPFEKEYVRKDGTRIPITVAGAMLDEERVNGVAFVLDITERKRMEERIRHLNLVLKAIRNVNQLIVREKDPETLIRRSCQVLTETRGYFSAWIALHDESGKYLTAASAGLGDAFEPLKNRLGSGQLAACDRAVHERGVHVVRNPAVECPNCPAAALYRGQSAIAVRLEHEGHVHGLLVMSMDPGLVDLVDERNLIEEVADDIAYALHGLEVERRRGAAEEDLRKHRDELEQRVRDRTAQLEESNKELEAFSYSVSHDLRAPLRAIDGFTSILTGDYAPQLDAEGRRVCSVIHDNTRKMSQLIDDLLAFSRLGRAEMSLSPIDMGTMANSVFHELTTPESRARIDFQVGVLPPAVADPTLMRQVWMNLLANAIKFSSKRQRAVIKVSARQSQGENVYLVQDHGAGFDMQYVGKLFGVFQRLHTTKEFEGTGVGLALVQRVLRRHAGRVWAEGEPDKGATFYFALQQRGA